MPNLSVNGASGRMGQAVIRCLHDDMELFLQEALEREGSSALGMNALALAGVAHTGDREVLVVPAHQPGCDVMIDFSLPPGMRQRLAECVAHGTAFVSGTTGLNDDDKRALQDAAATIPVLHASNFSVGVALLARLCQQAASVIGDYDIEIVEMHHNRKQDAPSGTADRLLRAICETLARDPEADTRHGRQGITGARTHQEIGMHALRGGDVIGDHTVIFAGQGERIELTHKASTRDTFARGAIRAAKALVGRKPGLYTIEDVLFG